MTGILDLLTQPPVPPIDYSPPGLPPRNVPGLLAATIASAQGGEASLFPPNQPSLIEGVRTPIDVQALYDARRNHPGYWETYTPTKREWIGDRVYDAGRMMGFDKSRAHRLRGDVGAALDFVPVVSALLSGEDFGRAYNAGDYPGMAMAAAGIVPGGRPAGNFLKKLLANSRYHTEYDLLQSIASRVEAKGIRNGLGPYGTGPGQGTKKHKDAKGVLERYQRMTGRFEYLLPEYSQLDGEIANAGTLGSSKADVFSSYEMGGTDSVYDYKFTRQQPPSVGLRQLKKYWRNFPGSAVIPIGPLRRK